MKMATAAGRRYVRRFIPTMLAYVAALFASIWIIRHQAPTGGALVAVSVLPALPIVGVVVVMGRYLMEETDEFLRQRIATCMLFGTGVLLSLNSIYAFLTNSGAFDPDPELFMWAFPIWCGSWGLAQCVLGLRDRLSGSGE